MKIDAEKYSLKGHSLVQPVLSGVAVLRAALLPLGQALADVALTLADETNTLVSEPFSFRPTGRSPLRPPSLVAVQDATRDSMTCQPMAPVEPWVS